MFKTLLLTAKGYTASKILSINFRYVEAHSSLGRKRPCDRFRAKALERTRNYEDELQADGLVTQSVTLLQPAANPLPILVLLMATQKTRATSTTIKVYSTKP
jgi:hypothetical protein